MRHFSTLTKTPLLAQDDPSLAEKLGVFEALLQNVTGIISAFRAVFLSKEVIDGGGQ